MGMTCGAGQKERFTSLLLMKSGKRAGGADLGRGAPGFSQCYGSTEQRLQRRNHHRVPLQRPWHPRKGEVSREHALAGTATFNTATKFTSFSFVLSGKTNERMT